MTSPRTLAGAAGCRFSVLRTSHVLLSVLAVFSMSGSLLAKESWFENPVQKRAERESSGSAHQREVFAPPPRGYKLMFGPETEQNLRLAIRRYEALVAAGGWAAIPSGPGLGPGSVGERVGLVRRRLMATGDLSRSVGDGYKYKAEVVEGVKRFQHRHGLKATGRVYGSTLQALNVPAKQRLAQLRLNLERVKKISRQLKGHRFVVVNIPAYELQAVEAGRVALYSRVIAGKPSTPTPILTASIRALNFFPHWNVPKSIAARALVPAVMRDPNYLARERIRVFAGRKEVDSTRIAWSPQKAGRYSFRQDPGPGNALGLIRLDMPNKHTVYMHDTPLQRLFRYGVRAYSAGCVRVHRVFDLAAWLLKEKKGWDRGRIDRTLSAGEALTVTLPRRVPVYFVYVTAWGAPDGSAQFRVDIYNRDGTNKVVAEIEGSRAEISALTP